MRKVATGALAVAVLAAPVAAAPSAKSRARVAVRYLQSQQADDGSIVAFSPVGSTADAVAAMVAARRAPNVIERALEYLEAQVQSGEADTIGLKAKVAMAAVAGGRDPSDFGNVDLVAEIQSSVQDNGRLGAGTPVFEHALGLLAIQAAQASFLTKSVEWLVDGQCNDGGWQFDEPATGADDEHCFDGGGSDNFQSDTNTTSLVVQVLANIEKAPPEPNVSPFKFFRKLRDDVKRGWGFTWGFTITDANSTALVLQAYAAAGREVPEGAKKALRDLQYGFCSENRGAFGFTWADEDGDGKLRRTGPDVGATIGAIPGLLGKPFPVEHHDVVTPAPKPNCE